MRRAGVPPQVRTYNLLTSACSAEGDWQKVMQLMSELRSHGLVADTPIHAALITACEKAGNFAGVSGTFMTRLQSKSATSMSCVEVNTRESEVVYQSLLLFLVPHGSPQEVCWERGLQSIACYRVAPFTCYWTCVAPLQVLEQYAEMQRLRIPPTQAVYASVMKACIAERRSVPCKQTHSVTSNATMLETDDKRVSCAALCAFICTPRSVTEIVSHAGM
jgi:pentatricopeptide repeat protein